MSLVKILIGYDTFSAIFQDDTAIIDVKAVVVHGGDASARPDRNLPDDGRKNGVTPESSRENET